MKQNQFQLKMQWQNDMEQNAAKATKHCLSNNNVDH